MKSKINHARRVVVCAAFASAMAASSGAHAALTLTAAGVADGFTLSTFYTDTVTYGMLGMTTTSTGKVIGAAYNRGGLALFNDVDGQTYGSAIATNTATPGTPTSVATVGGKTYVSILGSGYYEVNLTTLALTPLTLSTSLAGYYGMAGNFATGHLLASTYSGLYDINPLTGATHLIHGGFWDGVSVSPDGKTAYGATAGGGPVYGFDIATGATVLTHPSFHSPDGTGVISGGAFNGHLIINNNDGTVGLLNPFTSVETIIASGGSRGDLVGPDLTNGTLFLSYYEAEYRLGIKGGVIGGGGGPGVPEPATWALMLLGFGALGVSLRRRRAELTRAMT